MNSITLSDSLNTYMSVCIKYNTVMNMIYIIWCDLMYYVCNINKYIYTAYYLWRQQCDMLNGACKSLLTAIIQWSLRQWSLHNHYLNDHCIIIISMIIEWSFRAWQKWYVQQYIEPMIIEALSQWSFNVPFSVLG